MQFLFLFGFLFYKWKHIEAAVVVIWQIELS